MKDKRIMEQISIFQFIEDQTQTNEKTMKLEGIRYAVKDICKSSGQIESIRQNLEKGDTKGAYAEFKEAFRTYGFHSPDKSFSAYKNKGQIRYYGLEFQTSCRKMFNILLDLWEQGELE